MVFGNSGNSEGSHSGYTDSSAATCLKIWGDVKAGRIGSPYTERSLPSERCNPRTDFGYAPAQGSQPGFVRNPANASEFFCQSSQPLWSAFRAVAYGFAALTFESDTRATWKFVENNANAGKLRGGAGDFQVMDGTTYERPRNCPRT
jgi:hypothetical protein